MNLFEGLKSLYEGAFLRGQHKLVQQQAAQDLTENLEVVEQAAKAAAETLSLAEELAADNNPHKKRLAALIKDYATEGMEWVLRGQLSAKEVLEPEHPFSENSEPSRASLPATAKPLPMPEPSPPLPSPPKRGRGRPRKNPPPP